MSDPVPIGLWILTAFGLAFGLGLGILDLGLGLDKNITNKDSDIKDRSESYGLLNGPGMDKKYDRNTLWSTFYCL